jgi:hypothetical protein
LQQLAPFQTHGVWHGQDATVTSSRGHHCQANAGVATGRLQDDRVRADRAGGLGRFDHAQCDPVFHAAAGILELQFEQYFGVQACGHTVQAYQGRVSDQIRDIPGDPRSALDLCLAGVLGDD